MEPDDLTETKTPLLSPEPDHVSLDDSPSTQRNLPFNIKQKSISSFDKPRRSQNESNHPKQQKTSNFKESPQRRRRGTESGSQHESTRSEHPSDYYESFIDTEGTVLEQIEMNEIPKKISELNPNAHPFEKSFTEEEIHGMVKKAEQEEAPDQGALLLDDRIDKEDLAKRKEKSLRLEELSRSEHRAIDFYLWDYETKYFLLKRFVEKIC